MARLRWPAARGFSAAAPDAVVLQHEQPGGGVVDALLAVGVEGGPMKGVEGGNP